MPSTAKGLQPGTTGTFLATPADAAGVTVTLPEGVIPIWTSSDPVNAPVVPAADGLSATVGLAATATAATEITLTVEAVLLDGTKPSGAVVFSVLTPEVAQFIITQQ